MIREIAVSLVSVWFHMFPPKQVDREIKKMLVFGYPGIGDCLMMSPTIRELAKQGIEVDVLVYTDQALQTFKYNPYIKKLYLGRGIKNLIEIRKQKYDACVCLNLFSEPIYAYLAGIPIRKGQDTNGFALTHKFDWQQKSHSIDFIAEITGVKLTSRHMDFYLGDTKYPYEAWDGYMGYFCGNCSSKHEYNSETVSKAHEIIIVPDAGMTEYAKKKKWPEQKFAEVINKLDCQVTLCGKDYITSMDLKHLLKYNPIDLTGKHDILQLGKIISNSSLVICNDSAAMHIAACFDVPCVTIFGPTDPSILAHDSTIVVEGKCPYGYEHCFHMDESILMNCDRPCLFEIKPDMVYEKVKGVLNES